MAKPYKGPVTVGQELWVTAFAKSSTASLSMHTPPLRFIAGGNHAASATSSGGRYGYAPEVCRHPSNVWDKKGKASNYYQEIYASYDDAYEAYCEQIDKVIEQVEDEKRSLTYIQKKYAAYKDAPIKGSKKKSNLTI